MLYTDLESLAIAASQLSLEDKESLEALGKLVKVYFTALHNPPEGIIGVGAITYAEQCLIDSQLPEGVTCFLD